MWYDRGTQIALHIDEAVRRVLVHEFSNGWDVQHWHSVELVGVWDVSTKEAVLPLLREVLWVFLADDYETIIDLKDPENQRRADAEFGAFYVWWRHPTHKIEVRANKDLHQALRKKESDQREAWEKAERRRRADPVEQVRWRARMQRELESWDAMSARVRGAVLDALAARGSA